MVEIVYNARAKWVYYVIKIIIALPKWQPYKHSKGWYTGL